MGYEKLKSMWVSLNVWLDRKIGFHDGYYVLQNDLSELQDRLDKIRQEADELQCEDD